MASYVISAGAAAFVTVCVFVGSSLSSLFMKLFESEPTNNNNNELNNNIKIMSTEIKQTSALEIALLCVILTTSIIITMGIVFGFTRYMNKKCKKEPVVTFASSPNANNQQSTSFQNQTQATPQQVNLTV